MIYYIVWIETAIWKGLSPVAEDSGKRSDQSRVLPQL